MKLPGFQYFNCLTVLFCLELGRIIKQQNYLGFVPGEEFDAKKRISLIVITVLVLYEVRRFGAFAVRMNQIGNPLIYYVCGIMGWLFLCNFSYYIEKIPIAKEILALIGQHTLAIMLFHFAAFKIVTLIEVLIMQEDIELLKSHPCFITEGGWWMIYTIAGVLIPTLIGIAYNNRRVR